MFSNMTRMNSAAANSGLYDGPKKVIYLGTMIGRFYFPTPMSVGDVLEISNTFEHKILGNRYYKFLLKKSREERLSILCERHVKDETLKADSVVEQDALEEDDGCFLRLYISVIGVNEKPKSAVLRSTDTYTSVEFMEDSFLHPKVDVDYVYFFKCVIRKIETTILPNEEQELEWQQRMSKACKSKRHRKNMAFVLERPNLDRVLTGRNSECVYSFINIVCRACSYHNELVQYIEGNKNSKPISKNTNLGIILGYLHTGENKRAITEFECVELYVLSQSLGLKFVKKLCTAYMTENLNNEFVVDVLRVADMTEDSRLFNAAWLFCIKNKLQLFNSHKWQVQAGRYLNINNFRILAYDVHYCSNTALGIVHGFLLRCYTDNLGFPPALEDESGQP